MSKNETFQGFPELPPELRMMVIDEMEPDDRCRFSGSSHLCWKEGRKSKKYIYGLEFYDWSQKELDIKVVFGPGKYKKQGFNLNIKTENENKYLKYSSIQENVELWRMEFKKSTDLVLITIEHFKKILNLYQNTIKSLVIDGSVLINHDLDIRRLNNLEKLDVCDDVDITEIITKTRKPLKKLWYYGDMDDRYFEQVSQVQNCLEAPFMEFDNVQLLQLSASHLDIHIGQLTEIDIANFINNWRSGIMRKNFESCKWNLWNSNFNVQKLYRLLGIEYKGSEGEITEIKHNKDPGKSAEISHIVNPIQPQLEFCVTSDGN